MGDYFLSQCLFKMLLNCHECCFVITLKHVLLHCVYVTRGVANAKTGPRVCVILFAGVRQGSVNFNCIVNTTQSLAESVKIGF